MKSYHSRAIEMIQHQITQVCKSVCPDEDFCEGMIQANVAQGHISTEESVELMQLLVNAVSTRRRELQQHCAAQRLAAYELHYERAS
ncbi:MULTISPECIES: hypothetical protein [Pseudomonas]|uniref:Uncharacterized protein n=1 Tax=Pseudomonas cedrina TaxID=651740 RepID=A0A2S9E2N3_PSECE|nr:MULTISPECIES: hypothetical protein [Pseudomonas]AVJ20976.1 hypothetical protein CLM72_04165 [Pseudomonas sp. MYb193]PRC09028.1 hypothetical protein CQ006_04790 [Pseudomonas cedrina]